MLESIPNMRFKHMGWLRLSLAEAEMEKTLHMSGNYWDLTWDSMEISNLYFSYITFYVLLIIIKIFHDI